jgi:hypothetical protein
MLTLYVLFIFALSSSVTAAPLESMYPLPALAPDSPELSSPGQPLRPWGVFQELLGSQDVDMLMGVWGRVLPAPWEERAPQNDPRRHNIRWTDAQDCDDFIQFHSNSGSGIDELSVHRVKRELVAVTTYRAVRRGRRLNPDAGCQLVSVYPIVPMDKWGTFLHDTWWSREPGIVGEVSNAVTV